MTHLIWIYTVQEKKEEDFLGVHSDRVKKTENQWSYSSPETICSGQVYDKIF